MKKLKRIGLVFFFLLLWTAFIGYGFIDGFLLRPITNDKSPKSFLEASKEIIQNKSVGNLGFVLLENGRIAEEFYDSKGRAVDQNTMFPVASISKWVASFGVMKLVQDQKIDLDAPVEQYLTRWHLPESEFDNSGVTVRRLLSHSAGLVDDLGYAGFETKDSVQTLEASLTKAKDGPYSEGVARVGYQPGSQYMYSGASYALLQLLIEEVSGQSFQEYMKNEVFKPLGMTNSVFERQDPNNPRVAEVFQVDGSTRSMNWFTALAAAGLYTSTGDLSKFLAAHVNENPVLSKQTIAKMSEANSFINTIGIYGLGPHLYSQNKTNSLIIGHDGSGNDAINTAARIDLMSKSGIIFLETGNWNLASSIADEWLFWKAGIADYVVMQRNKSFLLSILGIGYLLIILASVFIIKRRKQAPN
ncbi:MAG: serine hydrolase [Flavobacteriaceae bacterium]|nr:serine hydrolase [Flavobacteriaceae bacterium]|tara:strand:- start:34727 stop:35974 length:1248 start_codon:yes stop_codon:yes gene_type:complete